MELVSRGYCSASVQAAFDRVRLLDRNETLVKVPRKTNERVVLTFPFDKRLPDITSLIRHHHQCLLDSDINAQQYMPLPPMVLFT